MKYVTLANSITSVRILGTLFLLFTIPFSPAFFTVYTISGISDAIDGLAARLTNTVSDFGAKLDSVSDLLFYGVMIIRIMPSLIETLPVGIWYAVVSVVILRIISYLFVALKYKKLASLHTKLNKITGFAVFLIPYVLHLPWAVAYCITVCSVSAIATVHELILHLGSTEYLGR